MRLIKPSFEIWEQEPGIQGIYKAIERAGRICYKSSPKYRWYSEDGTMWVNEGTEDWRQLKDNYPVKGENISAKDFVEKMVKSGHGAMLEHGTVYLAIPFEYIDISAKLEIPIVSDVVEKYKGSPYAKWHLRDDGFSQLAFITTNYRVLVENGWLDDLKYLCEPTEYHERRVTVHFVCDRGVSHEFVRHRVFSFAQESTRYCNYSKDKFGNNVTFIIPCWTNLPEQEYGDRVNPKVFNRGNTNGIETSYVDSLRQAEYNYFNLLNQGWKPQQARAVLPNALKTELVMTGFVSDWKHFFFLRCPLNAHPQARELAIPLSEEFVKRELIK